MKVHQLPPWLLAAALVCAAGICAGAVNTPTQAPASVVGQHTTKEYLRQMPWWPTKILATGDGFVGAQACAECHQSISAHQAATPMALTAKRVGGDGKASAAQTAGKFQMGEYQYDIHPDRYSVTDGKASLSEKIDWAFGLGRTGQSYLTERDGKFLEARFTYFGGLHAFDRTPGRMAGAPDSLPSALAHVLSKEEAVGCFQCHTTGLAGTAFDSSKLTPGITCEGCHGPGREHVQFMQASDGAKSSAQGADIFSGRGLTPAQSVDFCGSCHFTWWDAAATGGYGVAMVRFPAYRLENSRCWGGTGDARVTCVACHDPHRQLETQASAYDGACAQCHAKKGAAPVAGQIGKSCPVAVKDCVSCHMPKYEIPEMHYKFTDHQIRVVRAGEAFPG